MFLTGKKKCRAIAGTSKAQCTKHALWGSPYCWWHQAKGITIATLLLGGVIGFFADLAKDNIRKRYFDPRANLKLYVNGEGLALDTLMIFNAEATNFSLKFGVANGGNLSANNVSVTVQLRRDMTNKMRGSGWRFTPASDVAGESLSPTQLANWRLDFERPIHSSNIVTIPTIELDLSEWKTFGMVVFLASNETPQQKARLHLVRQSGPLTNTLRDAEAEQLLRGRHEKVYSGKWDVLYSRR